MANRFGEAGGFAHQVNGWFALSSLAMAERITSLSSASRTFIGPFIGGCLPQ